jgi:Tol biopolymer transport system component
MTATERLERDLSEWFAETAAPQTPDYTDDILRRAARVRQRPRWLFAERWLPMSVISMGRQALRPVPWRTVGLLAALLLLLVVVATAYVGGQRRVPAPFGPATNGSIAIVTTPPGYENTTDYNEPFGDILAVDPTTGATTTIVGGPELDGVPAYALDGTRLSFVRQVPGGVRLFAVDAAAGTPTALTTDPLPAIREAAWSPDGRSVAFTVPSDGGSDLWLAAADGSGARRLDLGDLAAVSPQWRPPDGRELLFAGSEAPGLDQLGAYHGIYGFDGASGLGLYRVRPDGTGLAPVTMASGAKLDYGWTSWSPDGQRIVTQVTGDNGFMRVTVLDESGRELTRVDPAGTGLADAMAPVVSPDGTRIAYAVATGDSWQVHVRPIDGGQDLAIDHEFVGLAATLRWSPDGRTVIVNHHVFPGTWLLDPNGGPAREAPWTDPGFSAWQRNSP